MQQRRGKGTSQGKAKRECQHTIVLYYLASQPSYLLLEKHALDYGYMVTLFITQAITSIRDDKMSAHALNT